MAEPSPHEHVVRELIEVHGYRPPLPPPERWYASSQGRIRVAAWTALGALIVIIGPASALTLVSETAGIVLAVMALAVLLLCAAAIYVDTLAGAGPGAEEGVNERAVARMVSGKGVSRRESPPDGPHHARGPAER